jgi:protein SCO1/2
VSARLLAAAALLALAPAQALPFKSVAEGAAASDAPPSGVQGAQLVEHLGEPLPTNLAFTDSQGKVVRLAQLIGARKLPVVLTLVYYDCPMLCGLLLSGLSSALARTGLALGRDYDALTLSFNARETPALAADRQGRYLQALGRPEAKASWAFLVGEDAPIHALADAVGFRFKRDERTGEYAHIAVAMVLTPDGRLSRYLYGVQFEPRDLKLAIVEAGDGRVGTTLDRVLMTCFRWNPATRRYALFLSLWFKLGGVALLAAVGTLLVRLWRREARQASCSNS